MMAYEVARAIVGVWNLTLDDVTTSTTDVQVLELSIEGDNFDVSVNIPCLESLQSIANSIESCKYSDITAKEQCFAGWTVADLFVFADEFRLTFLLLATIGEKKRIRISTPATHKADFLMALHKLKDAAEAEL